MNTTGKALITFIVSYSMGALIGIGLIKQAQLVNRIRELEAKLDRKPIVENVIRQETPEKFYEINGKRVYLEIDGKPVEQYFKGEQ